MRETLSNLFDSMRLFGDMTVPKPQSESDNQSRESEIGQNLAEARLRTWNAEAKRPLQLDEVAVAIGRKKGQTVSSWEAGKTMPNAVDLSRLAKLYGVTADYLLRPRDSARLVYVDHERVRELLACDDALAEAWQGGRPALTCGEHTRVYSDFNEAARILQQVEGHRERLLRDASEDASRGAQDD